MCCFLIKKTSRFIVFCSKSDGGLHSYLVPLFLRLDLLKVEFQFLAFQNVAIGATALSGAGRDASCQKKMYTLEVYKKQSGSKNY